MNRVLESYIIRMLNKDELLEKGYTSFIGDTGRRFDIEFSGASLKVETQGTKDKFRTLLGFIQL